jgi:hypothetical protein
MEACYGGTDVMERSCAVARGILMDINTASPACKFTRPDSASLGLAFSLMPQGSREN